MQGLWTVVGVQVAKPIKQMMSPQLYVSSYQAAVLGILATLQLSFTSQLSCVIVVITIMLSYA